LDFQLNDEQLHLKKSVREFAGREILPNVMKWDEAGEFPLIDHQGTRQAGNAGDDLSARVRWGGDGYVEYVTVIEELSRVDGSVGIIVAAHTSLCSNHIFVAGNDCQKKKYNPQAGDRRIYRGLGIDRAVVGIGCGQRSHDRHQGQGRMGSERHQDFYHQWPLCRRAGRACRDGPRRPHSRALRVRRRKRYKGLSCRQERKQAWPARQRHHAELIFEDCFVPRREPAGARGQRLH